MDITRENVIFDKIYEIPVTDPDLGTPEHEEKLHRHPGNRAISLHHVKEIRNAINPTNWRNFSPIEVNIRTMCILDGQHRWQAFVTLDDEKKNHGICLQIKFYDILEEKELELIRDKNTKNKNWTTKAFAESNRAIGTCNEITWLYEFCNNHEKCHKSKKDGSIGAPNLGYGGAFLWGKLPNAALKNPSKFRGSLKLSRRKIDEADALYKEVDMLVDALGYTTTSTWYERFAQAWYEIHKDEECSEQLRDIGLTTVCNNLKANPIAQQTTNKNEWFDYFKEIGLGLK